MAEIFPLPALRYNPEKVNLADVVTQPYDKITPEMQERYYRASDYNLVRIILGRPETEETADHNRYTQAANYLRTWQKDSVFRQDPPSIYAYSQHFAVPGTLQKVERRSFVAAGKLYDYAEKVVYRHEQTLSKPKSDRLNLLRATHAHFGQIFMLYSDPARTIDSLLFGEQHEWQEVTDEYGVLHRIRRVDDPAILNIVATEMADRKLIIADGHHRYETALNFKKELGANDCRCLRNNSDKAMMTFVNMDSPGLVILPTHRVIFGLRGFNMASFVESARRFYEVSDIGLVSAQEAVSKLAEAGKAEIGFVATTRTGSFLLRAQTQSFEKIPSEFSARQRRLDVVHLHSLLLEQVLGITRQQITEQHHVRYLRSAEETLHSVQADSDVNVAFLMNPVSIEQVREIAFAGEVLPQKSTDFYPKLLSGLTIFSLKGNT
ncbi:MAG TPA: DUF1015 domain-containing protein [Terriglobales bacterium]|nr:DUF1015 domain-containing protein [Terriglobales bacterium]